LRPFTEVVLDDDERKTLFKMLDGENKGYVTVQLTENEHQKCEELKRMRKPRTELMEELRAKVNSAIPRMRHHQPNDAANGSPHAQPQQPLPFDPIMEEPASPVLGFPQMQDEHSLQGDEELQELQPQDEHPLQGEEELQELERPDEHSLQGHPASASITDPEQELQTITKELGNAAGDEELQELERRLDELRAQQAARLRRRRKRELEAEIEALQRELDAKTPTAKTPHASGTKSKVSFALPATLHPC